MSNDLYVSLYWEDNVALAAYVVSCELSSVFTDNIRRYLLMYSQKSTRIPTKNYLLVFYVFLMRYYCLKY
jgi:hypothetical protein